MNRSFTEGRLVFRPGQRDSVGSRPAIDVQTLLAGHPPQDAARLLPALFALCGGAHRAAARLAYAAAQAAPVAGADPAATIGAGIKASDKDTDGAMAGTPLDRQALAEHLRRIWLDWPRRLGDAAAGATTPGVTAAAAADVAILAASPALRPDAGAAAVRGWLAAQVFGQPPADWLAAWQARDDGALQRWLDGAGTLPAALLRPWAARARDCLPSADPPLPPPSGTGGAAAIPAAAPPRETGSWTRAGLPPPRHALDRLLARLAEIARLALAPAGEPVLAAGRIALGNGAGIGWCEMARGLLVHELRLDGSGSRIAGYRVVAPTEWNFHPRGSAAREIARLPADPAVAGPACALIACALDPCVEFRIETLAGLPEPDAHA